MNSPERLNCLAEYSQLAAAPLYGLEIPCEPAQIGPFVVRKIGLPDWYELEKLTILNNHALTQKWNSNRPVYAIRKGEPAPELILDALHAQTTDFVLDTKKKLGDIVAALRLECQGSMIDPIHIGVYGLYRYPDPVNPTRNVRDVALTRQSFLDWSTDRPIALSEDRISAINSRYETLERLRSDRDEEFTFLVGQYRQCFPSGITIGYGESTKIVTPFILLESLLGSAEKKYNGKSFGERVAGAVLAQKQDCKLISYLIEHYAIPMRDHVAHGTEYPKDTPTTLLENLSQIGGYVLAAYLGLLNLGTEVKRSPKDSRRRFRELCAASFDGDSESQTILGGK